MRHFSRALLALSLVAAGCGVLDDPLSRREQRELTSARARWNSSALRDAYVYEVRQSCFCPPTVLNWHVVTVVGNVVVNVVDERGGPVDRSQWPFFDTVDRRFARLEATYESYLKDITVRFDPQYGYPVEMTFEYDQGIADAGGAFYARNLRAVER